MAFPQLAEDAYTALIEELAKAKRVAKSGPWMHLPAHSMQLSTSEQQLSQKILSLLDAARFDPPCVRDIANCLGEAESHVRLLLLRLTRRGEVFQIVWDLFYSQGTVAELAHIAATMQQEQGEVRVAVFRDRTSLGRKRAVQILEFFDRTRFTRRVRDAHQVRSDNLLMFEKPKHGANKAAAG